MKPLLRRLVGALTDRAGTGSVDPATMEYRATPWIERETGGGTVLYTGRDRSVWLYAVLANTPLYYEDDPAALAAARRIDEILVEIGQTSLSRLGAMRSTASYRDIHLLGVRWDAVPEPPEGTPTEAQAEYLRQALAGLHVPQQAMFLGVKLRNLDAVAASRARSTVDMLRELVASLLNDDPTDYASFEPDREHLGGILARNGCRAPTRAELRQLEAWFNHGRHNEPVVMPLKDRLVVDPAEEIQFVTIERFAAPVFQAPRSPWIADALNHPDGPCVVSVRAELQTGEDTRKDLRRAIQTLGSEIAEDEAHERVERIEDRERLDLARAMEAEYATDPKPSLYRASMIFGRRVPERQVADSYVDDLRSHYQIDTQPLLHRQLLALDEVQPCSTVRCAPFPQRHSVGMIASAGVTSFTDLGDPHGAFIGLGLPDGTPVFYDPMASSRRDLPPATYICGRPGSGKTMLMQLLALQSVLMGHRAILVNPKGFDSLNPLVELVNSHTDHRAERVSLASLASEAGGGAFDPFRYALPETAAMLAANFITTVIDLDQRQRTALRSGLLRGAVGGAQCVGEALRAVDDRDSVDLVTQMWESTPLFQLAVGMKPRARFDELAETAGLLLVEFDVDLNLPSDVREHYSDAERIALAAVRCVTTAAVGILSLSRGGVMATDEAHAVLGHPDTVILNSKLMREGRSLNVNLIYASHLASDVLDRRMETYISRVFAMATDDTKEAAAAIQLAGLEPTPERVEMLAEAGPRRATADTSGRPAVSLHRDLSGRRSFMQHGPIPAEVFEALSTNIDDRRRREERREEPAIVPVGGG